jgi:hypothetical protein
MRPWPNFAAPSTLYRAEIEVGNYSGKVNGAPVSKSYRELLQYQDSSGILDFSMTI